MSISSLALAAKKVIDAAWLHGDAYDLSSQAAYALESAQLLQSPETAAESAHYRAAFEAQQSRAETLDRLLRTAQDRVAELEARLAEHERPADTYPPALPWARLMDADDLEGFLADLVDAASGDDDLSTLAEVESAIARWRVIGEAQHAHNTAPGPNADDEGLSGPCDCGEGAVHYTAAGCPAEQRQQTGGDR